MIQIKNRFTGEVLKEVNSNTLRGADLRWTNLREADLRGADLREADLRGADLREAYLRGADLREADLRGADLREADLRGADLREAYLRGADLREADLRGADLREADLRGADLGGAYLEGAKIEFIMLPSIKMLSSFDLGMLSDVLTLELMRRDAWGHPNPQLFDEWAKGGPCPYQNEDRFWLFEIKKELWKPGPPEMRDSDLILAICREKGWKVKGYIE
jgi:hypothetical protein